MADIKKIATRESYGNTLAELGALHEDLIVLDADLAGATKTSIFKKVFPDRHIDCGIAEANMAGIAAGLAACGKVPFMSSFAMFAAGRAYEERLVSDFGFVTEHLRKIECFIEAFDGRHCSGHRAGSDDYIIETAERTEIIDGMVELHLDILLLYLAAVPVYKLLIILLEGHGG